MRHLILILFLAAALTACNRTNDRLIGRAAALIDSHPDSALAALDYVDRSRLGSGRRLATFAMLYAQARDKNYFYDTDDSLISVAADYFDRHGTADEAMKAHYYKALTLYYGNDDHSAVSEIRLADEMSRSSDDTFLKGKINELIADIYHQSYNISESIPYRKKSVEYFMQSGKLDFYFYAVKNLAVSYLDNGNYYEGMKLLKETDISPMHQDSTFMCLYHLTGMMLSNAADIPDEALRSYHEASKFINRKMIPFVNYPQVALAYLKNGMTDSARHYLEIAAERDRANNDSLNGVFHHVRRLYFEKLGYTDSAFLELKSQFRIQNVKLDKVLNQNVAISDRDYFTKKSEAEKVKAYNERRLSTIIIVTIILVLAITIVLHRKRISREKEKFGEQIANVSEMLENLELQKKSLMLEKTQLQDENDRSADKINRKNLMIESLLSDNFRNLNKICEEYFDAENTSSAHNSLKNRFEDEIGRLRADESFDLIESFVNRHNDNIILKMRQQLTKVKEVDVKAYTLMLAGFSCRSVCLLCDISSSNYYNRRSRFRNKILESNAPDKDLFISNFI